ncbi:MAG TPA: DUF1501 domain-containing protein [Bryobacteraceae bacterium]|nr:DUF1501 domain-containing protein [Bryobacteraceae bacterium]
MPPITALTRRDVFRIGGISASAGWFAPRAGRIEPRGTARFCIFFMLDGGPSHADAWDLKEGRWTPENFDVREIAPRIKWPLSLYPRLASQFDKAALLRSVEARNSVHGQAQYYVQAAHAWNPALERESPPIGTIIAMEYAARRRERDYLPAYVALNVTESQAGLLPSGFLPRCYSPCHIDTFAAFDLKPEERSRYGSSSAGDAALFARNLVEADAGTHFIFLQQSGWDHHKDIYHRGNHYQQSWDLDAALSSLLDDLSRSKRAAGHSLLDETLIVCMGEFGRTPGPLTGLQGRDHYPHAFTALFAGGGVRGGQAIGKTDEKGARIIDSGWGVKRSVFMEDIAATIYSAMGIDWTKSIKAAPSGNEFHYVEPAMRPREISALFG